tara:strand:+ start:94 stop:633 length:540 start_codon:yes stop_codon:yes gene_type:complete
MNLRDLLNSPTAHHVSGRVVNLKVIGTNSAGDPVQVDATARFRFVDEQERSDVLAKADEEVTKRYAGRPVPGDRQIDERSYYMLHAALRDADNPRSAFAETPLALKRSLVLEEAQRVYREMGLWLAEEFPESISEEDMAKLVDEAKKNSLLDLLTSSGFKRTLSVLRSLAGSGAQPTQT